MFCTRLWVIVVGIVYNIKASATVVQTTRSKCETPKNDTYPEDDNVTSECKMAINPSDKNDFVHNIIISDYKLNFWDLTLKFEHDHWNKTNCAFQPLKWIWTYPGEYGAVGHLYWPESYKIWSLGILSVDSTYIPKYIRLRLHGNCSVTMGQMKTTERIGLALIQMANNSALIKMRSEIEYSYFCYTEQIWINKRWLYYLCLHMVCPLRALGRKCCRTVYEYESQRKRIVCMAKPITYGDIWWKYPFVIGLVMFIYFPLILLRIVCFTSLETDENLLNYGSMEKLSKLSNIPKDWLVSNPVSAWNLLKTPVLNIYSSNKRTCSKFLKISAVFLSLSVIAVEVWTSYIFEREYVIQGVKQGVPMNFLSVLAGFKASRRKFLFYFGGPFVALAVYVVSLSLLLCIPKRFSKIIENGIRDNPNLAISLLTLDLKTKGKLGGIYNLHHHRGYSRFFSLLKSHIFMLINTKFWLLGFKLQIQRLQGITNILGAKSRLLYIGLLILLPLYIFLTILEWTVVIIYFAMPVFSFFVIIVRGFWITLSQYRRISRILRIFLFPFIAFGMAYNIYLFSIVFVESFLFISRIFVFTLTGLIAYPNETYVYFVLSITITMYVVENVHSIRSVYDNLFHRIHIICKGITEKKLFPRIHLLLKHGDSTLLSRDVFYYVIRRHRPIRIDVCFSGLKLLLMMFVLLLAISIIANMKSFQKMESLTQVVTVLFICLVPKLWRRLCHTENKLLQMKENAKIQEIVNDYCKQKLYSRNDKNVTTESNCDDESSRLLLPLTKSPEDSEDELLFDPI